MASSRAGDLIISVIGGVITYILLQLVEGTEFPLSFDEVMPILTTNKNMLVMSILVFVFMMIHSDETEGYIEGFFFPVIFIILISILVAPIAFVLSLLVEVGLLVIFYILMFFSLLIIIFLEINS